MTHNFSKTDNCFTASFKDLPEHFLLAFSKCFISIEIFHSNTNKLTYGKKNWKHLGLKENDFTENRRFFI